MNHVYAIWRWLCLPVIAFAGVVVTSAPASADCVAADFYITVQSAPNVDVIAPNTCLTSTAWPTWFYVGKQDDVTGLQPGTPNGVGFDIWIPLPPA
jgi:hypothetical protein